MSKQKHLDDAERWLQENDPEYAESRKAWRGLEPGSSAPAAPVARAEEPGDEEGSDA